MSTTATTSALETAAERIAERLAMVSVGGTMTYAEMSEAAGQDVSRARHLIYRALTIARDNAGMVFANERGVGFRRMNASDAAQIGRSARVRIGRLADRGRDTIGAVIKGNNSLTPEQRLRISREQATLGVLAYISRDTTLAAIPIDAGKPAPPAEAAKEFLRFLEAEG